MVTNISQEIKKRKLINQVRSISDKYHNLSLLFYELSQSLRIKAKTENYNELVKHLKGFDFERLNKKEIKAFGGIKK